MFFLEIGILKEVQTVFKVNLYPKDPSINSDTKILKQKQGKTSTYKPFFLSLQNLSLFNIQMNVCEVEK